MIQPLLASGRPTRVYIVYTKEDERLRAQLVRHLSPLRRQGLEICYDREIAPGEDWAQRADEFLNNSNVIFLLVTANLLASDYCYNKEVSQAMKRSATEGMVVIPIIARTCDWHTLPLAGLHCLPNNGKPVTEWKNRDKAWLAVVSGIRTYLGLKVPRARTFPSTYAIWAAEDRSPFQGESFSIPRTGMRKGNLVISDIIISNSPNGQTAHLDFRVHNNGNADLLVNKIELRAVSVNHAFSLGNLKASAVYETDISKLNEPGDQIYVAISQLIFSGKVDRFELHLQYNGNSIVRDYVLEVRLHSSFGEVIGPIVNFTLRRYLP